jgi:hypothetical protein
MSNGIAGIVRRIAWRRLAACVGKASTLSSA